MRQSSQGCQRARVQEGSAPVIPMRDPDRCGVTVIGGNVALQPANELEHLWQRLACQLRLVLLGPTPHLHHSCQASHPRCLCLQVFVSHLHCLGLHLIPMKGRQLEERKAQESSMPLGIRTGASVPIGSLGCCLMLRRGHGWVTTGRGSCSFKSLATEELATRCLGLY